MQRTWDANKPTFPEPISLFDKKQCDLFISQMFPKIVGKDWSIVIFKVKKTLLPCLLAVGNHIKYDSFI